MKSDGRVLKLIESYLKAGVFEADQGWEATEEGTPEGGVLSPLLANLPSSATDAYPGPDLDDRQKI